MDWFYTDIVLFQNVFIMLAAILGTCVSFQKFLLICAVLQTFTE